MCANCLLIEYVKAVDKICNVGGYIAMGLGYTEDRMR